ncbi:NADPH:quinone reductase-like Zn-dependent oxidoreductase [Stenotrophomonas maltophilia]|uniref:zinc-binding dehydrogenase n=1 Tax=Stenotrophomonas chelatiphaga TaxID=517011 RepID=UPI000F4D0D79|nr:zinc-binding dehydrogenase [Stenotrophomonas chelatiphaga]MCS4229532.1 NADPH:quinone reductase-like Zn-dependent oxidoreductase [Stenotrophomonas chelatiphaga]ROQ46019.1 NADPH:quinone reductase-like Zn-dependent oxidoreductase [Stenotrophomonas maltophilia]
MRAALHASFGDPASVLSEGQAELPEPGPGGVRIRTVLAPIHNHDLWTVRGQYGYKPTLPAVGGSEGLGTIDALGEGVEGFTLGQRVAAASVHGTWAEAFIAPVRMVIPMPDAIADETAAQLIAMPLSALMLLEFLKVERGQWIVQNTANGAVGKTLAMLASARGVNVANLVRRDDGVAELEALGISNVFSTASEGWQDAVRARLGDALATAAVDSIGGAASGALMGLLGESGTLVSFGSMTGEPMQIPSGDVIFKQATVKGFWGSKVSQAMAVEDKRRLVGELLQRASAGELQLPVQAVYPLGQIAEAAAASLAGGRTGKVLLRP